MSNRRYHVKNIGNGSHEIYHGNKVIAKIEKIHHFPEFYNNMFGKRVPNMGKKSSVRYMVIDIPGITNDKFRSVKAAAQYASFHHLNNETTLKEHPIKLVGQHIEHLGKAIHASAADHRMTEEDQGKLLEISKLHASLRKTYQTHFSD